MLSKSAIEIDAKPKALVVSDIVLRQVSKDDEEDTGWRFQAIVVNESSSTLTDLEFALRYYDSAGGFLGVDEGFSMGKDDIKRRDDKAVSISLALPSSASRGVFSVKAQKTSFMEKHNFLLFGVALIVASVLFFVGNLLKG